MCLVTEDCVAQDETPQCFNRFGALLNQISMSVVFLLELKVFEIEAFVRNNWITHGECFAFLLQEHNRQKKCKI